MYVPEWFRIEDPAAICKIVRENSFATLVSHVEGEIFASHVPIVIDSEEPLVLIGHVSAQNAQVACFDGAQTLMAIFHGPHAYVSPSDYKSVPNVPTWNYVAVHAYGKATRLGETSDAIQVLETLVTAFDPDLGSRNPEAVSPEFWESKLRGIVAFRMVVDRVDAKGKLSQNKPDRDRLSVIEAMMKRGDQESASVAKAMQNSE